MKNKPALLVVTVLVLAILAVAVAMATGGNKKQDTTVTPKTNKPETSQSTKTEETTAPANTTSVMIKDFAYSPASITVKVGDTVTWTNEDSMAHTVTADDGVANGPDSESLGKGDSYSFKFTKAGTYTYHCTPHPYMKGTVTVE